MRAIICRAWGAPEDLRLEEVPRPEPGEGEVLIRVRTASVNYADSIMVAGNYQTKPPFPFSPGLECCGDVAAVGPGVDPGRIGERVMAIPDYGAFAEYVRAKADVAWPVPEGMDDATAGAFLIAYVSSHVAIRWQGRLAGGETMLVLGAAGGVGLTAVEIGRAMGARVIAAASSPERLALAAAHGAEEGIDYAKEGLLDRVMALTGGRGVDVVYDPVGGKLFDQALSSLGWGGRILLVGFVGGVPQIPANRLLVKHRAALGSSLRYFRWYRPDQLRESVRELVAWYGDGLLDPVVSATLPLERAAEAMRALTERRATGKLVLRVAE